MDLLLGFYALSAGAIQIQLECKLRCESWLDVI